LPPSLGLAPEMRWLLGFHERVRSAGGQRSAAYVVSERRAAISLRISDAIGLPNFYRPPRRVTVHVRPPVARARQDRGLGRPGRAPGAPPPFFRDSPAVACGLHFVSTSSRAADVRGSGTVTLADTGGSSCLVTRVQVPSRQVEYTDASRARQCFILPDIGWLL